MILFFVLASITMLVGCQRAEVVASYNDNSDSDQFDKKLDSIFGEDKAGAGKDGLQRPLPLPLPNFEGGPMRPLPANINFYMIYDQFPSYLLCTYRIKEENYDSSKEAEYFQKSLQQIRDLGDKEFPPVRWIAVIIRNLAEHKDTSTFEKSFKVGGIFKASDVFDHSKSISNLVSNVELDHHPFVYEPKQHTDTNLQQRWILVERHVGREGQKLVPSGTKIHPPGNGR